MATRVNVDVVPKLARPVEVEQAIKAATQMRDRARAASEGVAKAQQAVDEREREDVEQAAAKARAGEPLGQPARALVKARDDLLLKQRDANALRLASEQSDQELAAVIATHADNWTVELDTEVEQAREAGRAALAALQNACDRIGAATSAQAWITGALIDDRFDRPPRQMLAGSIAPTSRRLTANHEPLTAAELFGFVSELVEPPSTSTPAPTVTADTAIVT
jgi:hypothetical protein